MQSVWRVGVCFFYLVVHVGCGLAPESSDLSSLPEDRRLDQLAWLTTHNAYANNQDATWFFPNQGNLGITRQLEDGVGALMLDVHSYEGKAVLCHGSCKGVPFISPRQDLPMLLKKVTEHLDRHPQAVLTLFLEDYSSPGELQAALQEVPRIAELLFDPYAWQVREQGWPLLRELQTADQRLFIISDRSDKKSLGVAFAQDFTVENYWSMGLQGKDRSCRSRWDGIPLHKQEENFQRLFVMNHFRDVPTSTAASLDNRSSDIWDRIEKNCLPAAGKLPNYIAVDYYAEADSGAGEVVKSLNAR